MLSLVDYLTAWGVYLGAGCVFLFLAWRVTGLMNNARVTQCTRAVLVALVFTPWYMGPEEDLLAPAVLIALLDAITIGTDAAIRAAVPLLLAIVFSLLVVMLGLLFSKSFNRKAR